MPSHWTRRHPTDRSIQVRYQLSQKDLGGFPFHSANTLLPLAQIQRSTINIGSLNDLDSVIYHQPQRFPNIYNQTPRYRCRHQWPAELVTRAQQSTVDRWGTGDIAARQSAYLLRKPRSSRRGVEASREYQFWRTWEPSYRAQTLAKMANQ